MAESSVALVAKMEVRLRDMEKQLQKAGQMADKSVRQIENRFSKANIKLPSGLLTAGKLAGGYAIGKIVEAVTGDIRRAVASLADLDDAAQRIGTDAEYIQKFGYAVAMAGGTTEDATDALERFSKNLSEAGRGGGDLAKIFEANGIAIRNAKGELIGVEEAMNRFADLVKNAANPMDQLNLATMAFGRSAGPALVNALKDGSAGLAEMGSEAERSAAIVQNDLVKSAAELDDQFTRLEFSASAWLKSMAVNIAQVALPQLQDLINTLSTVMQLLHTDVGAYLSNPALETAKAQLKAGLGNSVAGAKDPFSGQVLRNKTADDIYDAVFGKPLQVPMKVTRLPSVGGGGGGGRRGGGGGKTDHDYLKEVLEDLRLELEKTQAIGDARDAILLKEETLSQIRRANVDAASAEAQQITELVKAIDEAKKNAEALTENLDNMRDVASTGLDTFVSSLLEGKSAADALNASLENILSTIASIAEKQIIESLLGKSGSTGGGLLSGLASFFGGARAGGGMVRAGRAYLVGERGPELMVPHASGTVVPAGLAGAGGGGTVVNVINNTGAEVSQTRNQTPTGERIDIMIGKMTSGQAATPGTDLNRTLRGTFGLQQGLTRR